MRLFDAFGRHKSERLYSTMNNWALSEIGPWTGFSVDSDELISHLLKITQEYPWVIIFSIDGVKVNPIRRLSYGRHPIENIDERIKIYQFLLEQSLKQSKSKLKAILPISVVDDDPLPQNFPVLSFQKKNNDKSILIPDPDFFYYNYYENINDQDTKLFNNKIEKAIFIGSSSGRLHITLNDLQKRLVPRIVSAQYFKLNNKVEFSITKIVQCSSIDVEKYIIELGLNRSPCHDWPYQYLHKFIISMDGNGACCSRICLILKSNSVLLKYESDNYLYYFKHLIPWMHYIPIRDDKYLEDFMEKKADDKYLKLVSDNATIFSRDYLSRYAVNAYMYKVIENYIALIGRDAILHACNYYSV